MRPLAAALLFLFLVFLVAVPVRAADVFATDTDIIPFVDTLPEELMSEPGLPEALFMGIGYDTSELANFDPSQGFESLTNLMPGQSYRLVVGFPLDSSDFTVGANLDDLLNTVKDVDCTSYDSTGICSVVLMLPPDLSSGLKTFLITVSNRQGDSYTLTGTTTVSAPSDEPPSTACTGSCASNVLFLPGIEGSRLYDSDENKLWEPVSGLTDFLSGDAHVRKLFLDENGKSVDNGIHTREGDVIDSAGSDIYGSFIAALNRWKTEETIHDWRAAAYDWRLSLADVLADGSIEETLRTLASTSPSGKATIIAHSNGGLLAKALLEKLGADAGTLVDNVILVGAPQSGAPQALSSILYGQDLSVRIPHTTLSFSYVSQSVTRAFALNSPMAYHLLPSAVYFSSGQDVPLVSFNAPHAYANERQAYGGTIDTWQELVNYLSALANPTLISYAEDEHEVLDSWTPPTGISAYQLAGAGADTIAGIEYYEEPDASGVAGLGYAARYRPAFTMEGDGTVPEISALLMPSTGNVKRYWFDLDAFNARTGDGRKHASMLGADSFLEFTKDILTHSSVEAQDISAVPIQNDSERIRFMLHSPLSLDLYDASNRHTGRGEDGSLVEDIPDTMYGEFGDVKYITAPTGEDYELKLLGQGAGVFSLDIQEAIGDESTTTTIAGVPTTASTSAAIEVSETGATSPLRVDEDGNGTVDFSIIPKIGETVSYEPAKVTSTPPSQDASAGEASTTTPPVTELIQEHARHSSYSSRPHKPAVITASSTPSMPVTIVASPFPYGPQFVAVDTIPVPKSVINATSSPNTQTQLASVYTALPHANIFARTLYSIGKFLSAAGRSLERLSGLGDGS